MVLPLYLCHSTNFFRFQYLFNLVCTRISDSHLAVSLQYKLLFIILVFFLPFCLQIGDNSAISTPNATNCFSSQRYATDCPQFQCYVANFSSSQCPFYFFCTKINNAVAALRVQYDRYFLIVTAISHFLYKNQRYFSSSIPVI